MPAAAEFSCRFAERRVPWIGTTSWPCASTQATPASRTLWLRNGSLLGRLRCGRRRSQPGKRLRRPAVSACARRSGAAAGCRTSRGSRRRLIWPAGGSGSGRRRGDRAQDRAGSGVDTRAFQPSPPTRRCSSSRSMTSSRRSGTEARPPRSPAPGPAGPPGPRPPQPPDRPGPGLTRLLLLPQHPARVGAAPCRRGMSAQAADRALGASTDVHSWSPRAPALAGRSVTSFSI